MSSLTSQKQNRALYTTLAVLLVTATVLSIVTFQADKKEKAPETTETKLVEQVQPQKKTTDTTRDKTARDMTAGDKAAKEETTTTTHPKHREDTRLSETETEKTAETTPEMETTATAATPQVLPTFASPIPDGELLRSHSVTVPVFSPTMQDYRTHTGIDLLSPAGSGVQAAADGKIGNFWYDPLMGYTLSVIHSGNAVSLYQGLAEELPAGIEPGAAVSAGQTIACVGNTALIECEDEPHLHFQLDIAGVAVDPMEYLPLP